MMDMPVMPGFFGVFDVAGEADWTHALEAMNPGGWVFNYYNGQGHGTGLFMTNPTVGSDVAGFIDDSLGY